MTIMYFGYRAGGTRTGAAASALLAVYLLGSASAQASNFRVNPVQLELAPTRTSTTVTLQNSDDRPLAVRARAYRWTQKDGVDVYEPTNDVIISPPIFSVPAKATQMVRVGMRTQTGGPAYRVILEEIPRPQAGSVNVALRLNLPLYILAAGPSQATVSWTLTQNSDGDTVLSGTNAGTRYLQVTQIGAMTAGKEAILSKQMGVVLPASMRQWNLGKHPELRPGTPVTLTFKTSSGALQSQIIAEKR